MITKKMCCFSANVPLPVVDFDGLEEGDLKRIFDETKEKKREEESDEVEGKDVMGKRQRSENRDGKENKKAKTSSGPADELVTIIDDELTDDESSIVNNVLMIDEVVDVEMHHFHEFVQKIQQGDDL